MIAELNRTFLRRHRRDGLTLELDYAAGAAAQVRELVRREAECCPFLYLKLVEAGNAVRLRVRAPAKTGDAATSLIAPFLAGASTDGAPNTAPKAESAPNCDHRDPCACGGRREVLKPTRAARRADGNGGNDGRSSGRRVVSKGATGGAAIAAACAVCCVLPFAMSAVALTTLGGVFAAFSGPYRWVRNLAVIMIATGWALLVWRSVRARRGPARSTVRAMIFATLVGAVAVGWWWRG